MPRRGRSKVSREYARTRNRQRMHTVRSQEINEHPDLEIDEVQQNPDELNVGQQETVPTEQQIVHDDLIETLNEIEGQELEDEINGVRINIQNSDVPVRVLRGRIIVSNQNERKGYRAAINACDDINDEIAPEHYIGKLDQICEYCGSYNFATEKVTNGFRNCCHKGKLILSPIKEPPPEIKKLFEDRKFKENIRNYNSTMAFASFGANIATKNGNGPYTYKIHGQTYHRIGSMMPKPNNLPVYNQLYMMDSAAATRERIENPANVKLDQNIIAQLENVIRSVNPYAHTFKQMKELEDDYSSNDNGQKLLRMYTIVTKEADKRRYNEARVEEISAIFVGDNGLPPEAREVIIYNKELGCQNINYLSPHVDPMVYPLLFIKGDAGYELGHSHEEVAQTEIRNTITLLQFYSYRLAIRNGYSAIHRGGNLLQQYVVDAYCKIEGSRLTFIRLHQKELRVESYAGLVDYLNSEYHEGENVGKPYILPSTFQGGPRNMKQNYLDAMKLVEKFGKPDLFITMTCNPSWREIKENLLAGQQPNERPDLVSRVFKLKLKELLKDLCQDGVLGKTIAHVYVIEFQKRGLPHAHILLILNEADKILTVEEINAIVCAEIPDKQKNPRLYSIVSKCMMHGPCGCLNTGAPCMQDGKCSKEFPKDFQLETNKNSNGYPAYRRRDTGNYVNINGKSLDNRWVVPYNPWLSLKYNCHINVEICSTVKSVKYIYKYVYKGHDCANVIIDNNQLNNGPQQGRNVDEIKAFLDARYVSAPEATWRIFENKMSEKSHSIIRLPLHLPNLHSVIFKDGDALEHMNSADTKLTAYFELNETNEEAREYLYSEIPYHFRWDGRENKWKERINRTNKVVSRIYGASPNEGERFYLRLLLLHVKGATSFEAIRTINNVTYATFKEACVKLNLLENDDEWINCLHNASMTQMPRQIRSLFATILAFTEPKDPKQLWITYKDYMIEDFNETNQIKAEALALLDIEDILKYHGKSCEQWINYGDLTKNVVRHRVTDLTENLRIGTEMYASLTPPQLRIANHVLDATIEKKLINKLLFMDGPGGSGKTFTYNCLINLLTGKGLNVISVAWTGIASLLLVEGRTVHSRFRLPLNLDEASTANIRHNTPLAEVFRNVDLIVWDEISMSSVYALEAVDRMLRDINNTNVPFGGKCILLGGDFRQIPPVVPHGTRQQIVANSVKRSPVWELFLKMSLEQNMRVGSEEIEFAKWLLTIGDGTCNEGVNEIEDMVKLPTECLVENILDLFELEIDPENNDLDEKVILCPKNDDCIKLNEKILDRVLGNKTTYLSADSIDCDDAEEGEMYPIEYINSLTPNSMPPHNLNIKKGCILLLLRNLDPKNGLCNGSRLKVKQVYPNIIDAEILNEKFKGQRVFLPRMRLTSSESDLPFTLIRKQFPVRLGFVMTINKSQGQTVKNLGIYLDEPVFCHGQLYVALSRVTGKGNLKIQVVQRSNQGKFGSEAVYTKNVVYPELLL